MSKLFSLAALLFILLLSKCSAEESSKKTMARRTAVLPNFRQNSLDPRNLWLLELSSPSLLEDSTFNWSCDETRETLTAEWSKSLSNCEDLRFLDETPKEEITCKGKKSFELKTRNCKKDIVERRLYHLRFSSADSLLSERKKDIFTPNSRFAGRLSSPSTLNFSNNTPQDLVTPNLQDWLLSSNDNGAIKLTLTTSKKEKSRAKGLLKLLSVQTSSRLLKVSSDFFPSILEDLSDESEIKSNKIPLPIVKTLHKDSLYQDTCKHVESWMRSRLALSDQLENLEGSITFYCHFRWGPNEEREHTFTHLALPLFDAEKNSFPFASHADSLDINNLSAIGHF